MDENHTASSPVSREQLDIMTHALGYNYTPRRVRNWFGVDPGSTDHANILDLVKAGLMVDHGDVTFSASRSYAVTEAGHELVCASLPKPKPLTRGEERYQRYLREDSGQTFREWLGISRSAFLEDER